MQIIRGASRCEFPKYVVLLAVGQHKDLQLHRTEIC